MMPGLSEDIRSHEQHHYAVFLLTNHEISYQATSNVDSQLDDYR